MTVWQMHCRDQEWNGGAFSICTTVDIGAVEIKEGEETEIYARGRGARRSRWTEANQEQEQS